MVDLQLAVAQASRDDWAKARDLAERLDGIAAFVAGLNLIPEGAKLAESIDASSKPSVKAALRLGAVPTSEGFAELAEAPGLRARLSMLAHEAFPNPSFMRWWSPIARRGQIGLAASYVRRLVWLARKAVPGFLAWRRAARDATNRT
jgi:hypothetical protein